MYHPPLLCAANSKKEDTWKASRSAARGGLEPRLCFCPRCGGDSPGCLTIGAGIVKVEHHNLNEVAYCYRADVPAVLKDRGWSRQEVRVVALEPDERVPGELCPRCQGQIEEWAEIVAGGGVYWRCEGCGAEGVVRPSEFTRQARQMALDAGIIQDIAMPMGVTVECDFHMFAEIPLDD